MKRHIKRLLKAAVAPPKSGLVPRKGQFIKTFLDHAAIGSGWRNFLVLRVSAKGVTLFYPPTLAVVKLSLIQWNQLKIDLYRPCETFLISQIAGTMHSYDRYGKQYNAKNAKDALTLILNRS